MPGNLPARLAVARFSRMGLLEIEVEELTMNLDLNDPPPPTTQQSLRRANRPNPHPALT